MEVSVTTIASIATAVAAGIAALHLWLVQRHAVTQFEDQLASQYRQLMREIPVDALLGADLADHEYRKALRDR